MDEFLFFRGVCRRDLAKDESCLYRAVSEKLYNTQVYHESIKELTVDFMKKNEWMFKEDLGDESIVSYLRRSDAELWPGKIELKALSSLFKVRFLIYYDPEEDPYIINETEFEKCTIVLAGYNNNRFDLVYKKQTIAVYSICQSIVYELLYKDVFELGEDVDLAVEKMLHDKNYSKQKKIQLPSNKEGITEDESLTFDVDGEPSEIIKTALAQGIPPFPYKIAKNLDTFIYRNVEFDIWNEERKSQMEEMITPPLSPGVKCYVIGIFKVPPLGYVQSIISDDKVVVYIENLAERREVDVMDLRILPISKTQALSYHTKKHGPYVYNEKKKRHYRHNLPNEVEPETPKNRNRHPSSKCDSGYSSGGRQFQRKTLRANSFDHCPKDSSNKKHHRPRSYSTNCENAVCSQNPDYIQREFCSLSVEDNLPNSEQTENCDGTNVLYVSLPSAPPQQMPYVNDYITPPPEHGSYNAMSLPVDIPIVPGNESKFGYNYDGAVYPYAVYSPMALDSQTGAPAIANGLPSFYANTPPHNGSSPTWVPCFNPQETIWPVAPQNTQTWIMPPQPSGTWQPNPPAPVWPVASMPVYSSIPPPPIMNGYSTSPVYPHGVLADGSMGSFYVNYPIPPASYNSYVGIPPPVTATQYFSAQYATTTYSEYSM